MSEEERDTTHLKIGGGHRLLFSFIFPPAPPPPPPFNHLLLPRLSPPRPPTLQPEYDALILIGADEEVYFSLLFFGAPNHRQGGGGNGGQREREREKEKRKGKVERKGGGEEGGRLLVLTPRSVNTSFHTTGHFLSAVLPAEITNYVFRLPMIISQ